MQFPVPLILVCFLFHAAAPAQDPPRVGIKRGRITLPPPPIETPKGQRPIVARNDAEQFYRDVIDLRRSKVLSARDEEQLLRQLRANYDDPAAMAIQLSLRCRNDLLHGLMKVVDRYGSKVHAEEMHFQVLSRPLGRVTARVIRTVVQKSGDATKARLFDYLVCKYAPARGTAAEMLPDYLAAEDIPKLIQLSRNRKSDIRRKVVSLFGSIDDPRVHKRLMQVLAQDPPVASDACVAAIRLGESMAESLAGILRRPARNKSFGFAVYALYQLERKLGRDLFSQDMVAHMVPELRGDDPFLRASMAIGLGSIAHREEVWLAGGRHDKKIVDNLLSVVAPDRFITSMKLIKPAATEVLVNFTGHDFKGRGEGWRGWWEVSRRTFVGLRRSLSATTANAGKVLLMWTAGKHFLVFRGAEVGDAELPTGSRAVFLDNDEMLGLVQELRGLGFMAASRLPSSSAVWTIDMRVEGSRILMRVAPSTEPKSRAVRMHLTFARVARAQLWQKHRDAEANPDAMAYWQTEKAWLVANPEQAPARLVSRILARLPTLGQADRQDALDDLQSIENLPELITELHGSTLVRIAQTLDTLDSSDFRLLELAVLAPGETVWRRCLSVLDGRMKGADDELATSLFRLLGPDRALESILHPSRKIAIAAIHDAASTMHRAAVPALLTRMKDADGDVQRTAVFALGILRAVVARQSLLQHEAFAHPVVRREVWGALGRIGGAEVVPVLKRAMENPGLADRMAALSAMGHTKSVELARFLAARFVTRGATADALSQRAELSLRNMGPLLAVPALRQHLQMEAGPARNELVMLLAGMQAPIVVPDLIDFLRHPKYERRAAQQLTEITGVDLRQVDNRSQYMRVWHAVNKNGSQGHWFLSALAVAQIPTSLQPKHLVTGSDSVAAVAELGRLLQAVKSEHLQVLIGALLRQTAGVDFTRGVRYAKGAALQAIVDRYKIHAQMVRGTDK